MLPLLPPLAGPQLLLKVPSSGFMSRGFYYSLFFPPSLFPEDLVFLSISTMSTHVHITQIHTHACTLSHTYSHTCTHTCTRAHTHTHEYIHKCTHNILESAFEEKHAVFISPSLAFHLTYCSLVQLPLNFVLSVLAPPSTWQPEYFASKFDYNIVSFKIF